MSEILIPVDLDDLATQVQLPAGCRIVVALELPGGQLISLETLRDQDRRELGEPGPGVRSDRAAIHEGAAAEVAEVEAEWDERAARAREPVRFTEAHAWLSAFVVCRGRGHRTASVDSPGEFTLGYVDLETGLERVITVPAFKATWSGDVEKGIRGVDEGLAKRVLRASGSGLTHVERDGAVLGPVESLRVLMMNPGSRLEVFGKATTVEP